MAEPWIRVHASLAGKPVVWRAVKALAIPKHEAMGLLVEFWGAVSQHVENGRLDDVPDEQIEEWAGWKGDVGRFAKFVRAKHLDEEGRVNEWDEYAGALEHRRKLERERKAAERRKKSAGSHADNPEDVTRTDDTESAGSHAENERDVTRPVRPARANETMTIRNEVDPEQLPSSSARENVLLLAPHRASWQAEMDAAEQGLHYKRRLTPDEVETACRDYLGNGAAQHPVLKHFRGYLARIAEPPDEAEFIPPSQLSRGPPASRGMAALRGDRNDAAIDQWLADEMAKKEAIKNGGTHGE